MKMQATDARPAVADAELLCSDEALAALAGDWNRLSGDIPFRTWAWCHTWWRHYRTPDDELFVLAVRDEAGEVVGLAPWYRSHTHKHGRVIRFLGCGEVCSDYLSVFVRPGLEASVTRRMAAWLNSTGQHLWDLLELLSVDREDLAVRRLVEALGHRGHITHELAAQSCWCLTLPATWDAYLAQLGKSRRYGVRTLERRQFESGRARVHVANSHETLVEAFDILCDLHQRRRNSLKQPGAFASSQFKAFHRDVAERFLAMHRLRLQWIEIEGQPVAAQYDLVGGDTTYFYQSGIHPEFLDEKPGWLSVMSSIRRASDGGYRNYDMLRGDEEYKAHWRAVARPMAEFRVIGQGVSARMRHQIWLAYQKVKGWKRGPLHSGG